MMDDNEEPPTGRRSLRPRNAQGRAASSDSKNTSSSSASKKTSANNTVSDVIDLSDLSDTPEDSDNSDVEFVPSVAEAKKLSKGKRSFPSTVDRAITSVHNGRTSVSTSSEESLAGPSTSKVAKTNVSKFRANLSKKLVPNNLGQNNNGFSPMLLIANNRPNNQTTPSNIVKFTLMPTGGANGQSTVASTALLVQSNSTANPLLLQSSASSNVLIPVSTTNAKINFVGSTQNLNSLASAQIQSKNVQKDLPVKIPAKTYSKTSPTKTVSAKRTPTPQQVLNKQLLEKVKTVYIRCEECNSQYHLQESFYSHIKYDHCKLPYRCLVRNCLEGFDEQKDYDDHIDTKHNLLTMYNCAKCSQVFKSYDYLSNHEELCHVTGLFQCSYCTMTANKRMPIHMHHLQTHHHICPECARSLPSKNDLKMHVKQCHSKKQTIVVPALKTIPVKQQLKQKTKQSLPLVAQTPISEMNLPPVPPEPEESFCDPTSLMDVRLKEEELDEDVQVIRHPKKRKGEAEVSSAASSVTSSAASSAASSTTSQSVEIPNLAPQTSASNGNNGAQKTRYVVLRRPDGTEQVVVLAPGVNIPGASCPSRRMMVVLQNSAVNKGAVNGGGNQAVVSQAVKSTQGTTIAVEEPLEDAISEPQEESRNYTVIKLNCLNSSVRCPKEFTSYNDLLAHMDEAHCILPFRCLHRGCGRSFGSLVHLNRHVVYHAKTPEKFRCSFCDSTFVRHRELANHLFNRHELGEFACISAGCTYRSISRGLMDEHFQKEHDFYCAVTGCKAIFKDKNEFENHEKMHNDFRRFYCKMLHTDKGDSSSCTFQSANKEEVLAHIKNAREGADPNVTLKDYIGVITGWHHKTVKKLILEEDEQVEISTEKTTTTSELEVPAPIEASGDENGATHSTNEAKETSDAAPPAETSGEASNVNLSETPRNFKTLNMSSASSSEVGDKEKVPSVKESEVGSAEVNEEVSANNELEPAAETNNEANKTVASTNDTLLSEANESLLVENTEPVIT